MHGVNSWKVMMEWQICAKDNGLTWPDWYGTSSPQQATKKFVDARVVISSKTFK